MKGKEVLKNFTQIIDDLQNQDLETVTELLNYYNGKPMEIEGITHHPYNDPVTAARINERYKELTGKDHPNFLKEQGKVIDGLLEDKDMLLQADAYTPMYFDTLEQLKGNLTNDGPKMEISNDYSKHILGRMDNIVNDLKNASLEDVSQLLEYYNGEPVLIEGVTHHPYNDPITAARINERYKELTGEDHSRYAEEVPKVIEGLLEDKEMLLKAEAYPKEYFEQLEEVQSKLTKEEPTRQEPIVEETNMNIQGNNENSSVEQTHTITRADILDTTENVKISDIKEDTRGLKEEVRAETEPTVDRSEEERI